MVIRVDVAPADVVALGWGLILFNAGLLVWFGYKVPFLARALRWEGEAGRRAALIIGRWLTFLGLITFLIPFLARAFGPVMWWFYLITFVAGGLRVSVTAWQHYRRS